MFYKLEKAYYFQKAYGRNAYLIDLMVGECPLNDPMCFPVTSLQDIEQSHYIISTKDETEAFYAVEWERNYEYES